MRTYWNLTPAEMAALIANGLALIVLILLAWLSASREWLLLLAGAVGGLGGLAHEFAQSKGTIVFFERRDDGLYLGSLAGVFLGAVAGLLAVRGYVLDSSASMNLTQLSYEGFFAGLALKGVAEAASGTAVTSAPSSQTPQGPTGPTA